MQCLSSSTVVTTLAGGNGGIVPGYVDAQGTNALFTSPSGLAIDNSGIVYIADTANSVVRAINASSGSTHAVFTC